MSRRNEGSTAGWGGAQAAMLGIGVLTLYPLYFIIITAFKTREEYLTTSSCRRPIRRSRTSARRSATGSC